ncbi:hypothetical protein P168DRAFT_325934 [Aspergillus campestris IBT 28561]|uniref:DNA polymerase delta subunit 3 n=1 Tax=Aspergillus campestris (strain IBT 28561) TaxID=1392248 RepID=A0A2I1D6T3_ASPC2|nr:uncharacterized protein P168DRAFT_325934 [Aspergillus campestris IBT 28561]PKY05591.1 hypothetical protein P168DRAFT_325934 [Aspergillus campestris IBT 28561]
MAIPDYKKHLAEKVLNESRMVTYRSLSRALQVHSTLAKQMLYDFHRNENNKKPNSVNATYLITGAQRATDPATKNGSHVNGNEKNGNDVMPSSPYIPSSLPNQDAETTTDHITRRSIVLVREEDLEDAKATFESIASVYIYSLQPTILQDLNVLTEVARETVADHAHEDPLVYGKQWGMIQNSNVKRRTGTRPPVPTPAPAASKPSTIPAKRPPQNDAPPAKTEIKKESGGSGASSQRDTPPASAGAPEKSAPVKKEKGNLFSSFAKAKPKQKKEESQTPAASGAESVGQNNTEDVVLDDASEEEAEELFPDSGKSTSTGTRESRKERQSRLRQMMEDDDEEMADTEEPTEPEPEPVEEESKPIDQPPPSKPELKEDVRVQGGRRRGKRQVMKKKTVKDDEGYLVTVEEPSWESFSEDEPEPPKKKPAVSAPRGKAGGAKPGQGSIMSFFGKK